MTIINMMNYRNLKKKCNSEEKLCSLLEEAADKLNILGELPKRSSFNSAVEIANFISARISDIKNGTISCENKMQLWGIFAPGFEWDVVARDVYFGNQIFRLVDELFGEEMD